MRINLTTLIRLSYDDTIVVDLQDIGTRFDTYMSTKAYMMETAAKQNLKVMILDRPNPINGIQIEDSILDQNLSDLRAISPCPSDMG